MKMDGINNASTSPVRKDNVIKRTARRVKGAVSKAVSETLDQFVPNRVYTSVEINHDSPDYQNINIDDGAKMVGYFTQQMKKQGFPWALYKPKSGLTKMKPVGEFEALNRLKNGESVIFQPKRVIGLGFNPPGFKAKDITGTEVSGKMDIKTGGMEVKHGQPVEIKGFGDLKFLYELYNPEIKIDPASDDKMKVAARELAYFTKGTMATQYPWKMFKPQGWGQRTVSSAKAAVKSGTRWAAIGAGVAYIAKLSSLAIGVGAAGPVALVTGLGVGAAFGIFKGAMSKRHGQEINAFESLSRLKDEKPVYFQEQKKKEMGISVPFPVMIQLGSLSYFTNHGEGSTITNLDELKTFHKIQEEIPPPKAKEG